MAVSKRTRFEVLRRDNYVCRYCRSTDNPLTVDHVTPVALGGTDDPSNLVAACRDCNAGKASSNPDAATVADVAQDAVRWAAAMKKAGAARARKRRAAEEYVEAFMRAWGDLSSDQERSVVKFYESGLPIEDLVEAARIACAKPYYRTYADQWRYLCGVAWKMLTEIQDEAARIVGDA